MTGGRFGDYGGQYVPETLMTCLLELEDAWNRSRADAGFQSELDKLLRNYSGRPTPLYRTRRWARDRDGGARV